MCVPFAEVAAATPSNLSSSASSIVLIPEFESLLVLRARVGPDNDQVGLRTDARGHAPAGALRPRPPPPRGSCARATRSERPSARRGRSDARAPRRRACSPPAAVELADRLRVPRGFEERPDARRDHRTYLVASQRGRPPTPPPARSCREAGGEDGRHPRADVSDAERGQDSRERPLLALLEFAPAGSPPTSRPSGRARPARRPSSP